MLDPGFLSAGRICVSSTRRRRSATWVGVEGSVVPDGLKRSVYVDNAVLAAVHRSARRFALISCFRALM